jgi:hypothetical protein
MMRHQHPVEPGRLMRLRRAEQMVLIERIALRRADFRLVGMRNIADEFHGHGQAPNVLGCLLLSSFARAGPIHKPDDRANSDTDGEYYTLYMP